MCRWVAGRVSVAVLQFQTQVLCAEATQSHHCHISATAAPASAITAISTVTITTSVLIPVPPAESFLGDLRRGVKVR